MKKRQLKVNNSYESEGSSASSTASSEGLAHRESISDVNDIRDLILPRQSEIYNVNVYEVEVITTEKGDEFVLSSSGEYFEGFTESEINEDVKILPRIKCKNSSKENHENHKTEYVKRKLTALAVNSSQESDFEGFTNSEIEEGNEAESVNEHHGEAVEFNSTPHEELCETNLSAKRNLNENPVVLTAIDENSCNAVDIKLINTSSPKKAERILDLSFNGKIEILKEDKISEENALLNISACTPPLFDDDDLEECEQKHSSSSTNVEIDETTSTVKDDGIEKGIALIPSEIMEREIEMLRRIKESLSGLPPPPCLTITQMNMPKEVLSRKQDIFDFSEKCKEEASENISKDNSLVRPTHSLLDTFDMDWPDILKAKGHGISYNLSTVTEKIELLCLAVIDRYVGAETSSSFNTTKSPSSAKKRSLRQKMLPQSPGNRLSHLAKRRAAFSSANLNLSQSAKAASNTSMKSTRQILLPKRSDSRKSKVTTPKRRTPGRTKNVRRTPSSRTKLIFGNDKTKVGPSRETSKRALFQSPPTQKPTALRVSIKPDVATRAEKSKRVLFSPVRSQNSKNVSDENSSQEEIKDNRKRKRDDDSMGNSQKVFCSSETPRALKTKSQSFCVTSNSSYLDTLSGKSLFRTRSDVSAVSSGQLNETHKKKLLWAVSQALQKRHIGVNHPNFKENASVLARVVKRFFVEFAQEAGGTSQRMLKLANKYVFDVMQGSTADEIYLSEKSRIEQEKLTKLTGYITPEVYENRKNLLRKMSSTSLFSENSIDPFSFTQSAMSITQFNDAKNFLNQIALDSQSSQDKSKSATKLPIIPDKNQQNSSSKNNLHGIALRENVDCELRKSAQKNFTGKDQKNVSPYNERPASNYKKYSSILFDANATKAKRQISFDN